MSENADLGLFHQITHMKKRAFLSAFAECGNVRQSAEAAGVSREIHYVWLRNDKVYEAAFIDAERMAVSSLEDEARARAIGPGGSDTLMIFLLKGLRPDRYKDRVHSTHDFSSTGDADLLREGAAIIARAQAQRADGPDR